MFRVTRRRTLRFSRRELLKVKEARTHKKLGELRKMSSPRFMKELMKVKGAQVRGRDLYTNQTCVNRSIRNYAKNFKKIMVGALDFYFYTGLIGVKTLEPNISSLGLFKRDFLKSTQCKKGRG